LLQGAEPGFHGRGGEPRPRLSATWSLGADGRPVCAWQAEAPPD
jgi:hypothetical protein